MTDHDQRALGRTAGEPDDGDDIYNWPFLLVAAGPGTSGVAAVARLPVGGGFLLADSFGTDEWLLRRR
jgi:hypothetical protein